MYHILWLRPNLYYASCYWGQITFLGLKLLGTEMLRGWNIPGAETSQGPKRPWGPKCPRGRNVPGSRNVTGAEMSLGRNVPGAEMLLGQNVLGAEMSLYRNVPGAELLLYRNVPGAEMSGPKGDEPKSPVPKRDTAAKTVIFKKCQFMLQNCKKM